EQLAQRELGAYLGDEHVVHALAFDAAQCALKAAARYFEADETCRRFCGCAPYGEAAVAEPHLQFERSSEAESVVPVGREVEGTPSHQGRSGAHPSWFLTTGRASSGSLAVRLARSMVSRGTSRNGPAPLTSCMVNISTVP